MIFYTISQSKSMLAILVASMVFAFAVLFLKTIFVYNHCNVLIKNIQLFVLSIVGGLIFLLTTHLFCYGEYSFFLLICYVGSFFFITNWCKKLLDFFSSKIYYTYIKIFIWEKKRIARKFSSIKD